MYCPYIFLSRKDDFILFHDNWYWPYYFIHEKIFYTISWQFTWCIHPFTHIYPSIHSNIHIPIHSSVSIHSFISRSSQCSTTGVTKAMVCIILSGMMHTKEPLLLIRKSSPCGSSGLPLLLSLWSFAICLMPYNCKCVECVIK